MNHFTSSISAALFGLSTILLSACSNPSFDDIVVGDQRTEKEISRNAFRHPVDTLEFLNVQPDMTVVEIWPGGGWYASILAPYLKDEGQYYAAHFDPESSVKFFRTMRSKFENRMQSHAAFSNVTLSTMAPPEKLDIAPEGSADRVLTFRNVHNWMRNRSEQAVFNAFYKALKPGGIVGVIEHRAPENFTYEQMVKSGYVKESYVIQLAEKAGLELLGRSEINRNPQDTKNYVNGVWTLPPTLRVIDSQRDRMLSIGESDRMTLKFVKPTND